MSMYSLESEAQAANPLDVVEQVVVARAWPFERSGEDELSLVVAGTWCELHLAFTWSHDLESMQLTAAFDIKVAPGRRRDVHTLLALINERLWVGHFDLWSDDHTLLYRHGHLLQGGAQATVEQCEALVQYALDTCERYYPAFQFVLWGGKSPEEAIAASLFDCVGEA